MMKSFASLLLLLSALLGLAWSYHELEHDGGGGGWPDYGPWPAEDDHGGFADGGRPGYMGTDGPAYDYGIAHHPATYGPWPYTCVYEPEAQLQLYQCLVPGTAICRDGWAFGIDKKDGYVKLWNPDDEVVYQQFFDAQKFCIGEEGGYSAIGLRGNQHPSYWWYDAEFPYIFVMWDEGYSKAYLRCEDIGRDDKDALLKIVDLIGEDYLYEEPIVKFKKGPGYENALWWMNAKGDAIAGPGCDWYYDLYCGEELYTPFEFTLEFELFEFCAREIPLTEEVSSQIEAALLTFLNQDAQCDDLAEGVIGCVDEVYIDIEVTFFENSNETCGTTAGTNTLPTSRLLWEGEEEEEEESDGLEYANSGPSPVIQLNSIRGGAALGIHGKDRDDSSRRLQRVKRSRRSRGRARGRGRCRRCRRRSRNSRKLQEVEAPSQPTNDKADRRSLQNAAAADPDLQCPPDLALIFREQNDTLFENVTFADIFNFTYLDDDADEGGEGGGGGGGGGVNPLPGDCIASFGALEAAIDASNCPATPTLELCSGAISFTGDIIKTGKCFSLTCPDGGCTLDVNGNDFEFLDFSSVSFSGITFTDTSTRRRKLLQTDADANHRGLQNFGSIAGGGCLAIRTDPGSGSRCEIIDCSFKKCVSGYHGGAIYSRDVGNLIISSSSFTDCRATGENFSTPQGNPPTGGSGGAIYVTEGTRSLSYDDSVTDSSLSIERCDFRENSATSSGGAIFTRAIARIDESTFFDSSANRTGGAIWTDDPITVENTGFEENFSREEDGGAVYLEDGDSRRNSTFFNCTFRENSANDGSGAALYVEAPFTSVLDSDFLLNFAERDGGAVYVNDADTLVRRCLFRNNTADGDGGAIFIDNSGDDVQIRNTIFDGNSATDGGGAIFFYQDLLVIDDCIFRNNEADDGGAIYSEDYEAEITNSKFDSNTAETGEDISDNNSLVRCPNVANDEDDVAFCTTTGRTASVESNEPTSTCQGACTGSCCEKCGGSGCP